MCRQKENLDYILLVFIRRRKTKSKERYLTWSFGIKLVKIRFIVSSVVSNYCDQNLILNVLNSNDLDMKNDNDWMKNSKLFDEDGRSLVLIHNLAFDNQLRALMEMIVYIHHEYYMMMKGFDNRQAMMTKLLLLNNFGFLKIDKHITFFMSILIESDTSFLYW
jgi:hypothetical protein